ncbi:putative signal transducing protein [Vibrio nitrifigilis]|uniref:DUF2007 domain-containing protein n=1 Tax=Vibrio nitrifigilis TaxID=2789781 RepID=A0ABS0GEH5_9VIBR|nr:DUF2007 domain-containing protein [Vibrio nitrifigilis]MBF9000770.1 DUF2007 domain-containing protein [Vibrio nitrifigilis]
MKLYIANNPTEAHILCGLLQQSNIKCEVRGEQWFGLRGEIPADDQSAPYIWLFNRLDADYAWELIRQTQTDNSGIHYKNWVCSNCGETNEGQFAVCWKCGKPDHQGCD